MTPEQDSTILVSNKCKIKDYNKVYPYIDSMCVVLGSNVFGLKVSPYANKYRNERVIDYLRKEDNKRNMATFNNQGKTFISFSSAINIDLYICCEYPLTIKPLVTNTARRLCDYIKMKNYTCYQVLHSNLNIYNEDRMEFKQTLGDCIIEHYWSSDAFHTSDIKELLVELTSMFIDDLLIINLITNTRDSCKQSLINTFVANINTNEEYKKAVVNYLPYVKKYYIPDHILFSISDMIVDFIRILLKENNIFTVDMIN